jgi:phage gp16-like protein
MSRPTKYPKPDLKRREITLIQIARQQLGMDDATYRDMLWSVARVKSSTELDFAGRKKVLDHLKACGFKVAAKVNEWKFIDTAAPDRQPLLRKICAVCRSMKVGKAYAEGAAKRQTGVDRKLEMMDEGQLWLLAGVLERTRKSKEQAK